MNQKFKKEKRYSKGRAFEYKVKNMLEKEGYFVIRSAGSHSVADLIAIHSESNSSSSPTILFIQCSLQPKAKFEIQKLLDICKKLHVTPSLFFKNFGVLVRLNGEETIKKYFNL
ncbi:MAG: hypothetical protein QXP52_00160 [Candidatus Aenigmatarchaeota archaeon]